MSALDEITLGEFKQLVGLLAAAGGACSKSHSLEVGKNYFVRTVTYHHVGRLASVTDTDIVLEDASWVASSGRWNAALTTGELDEVEPHNGPVIISRGAIVDSVTWCHGLPTEVK